MNYIYTNFKLQGTIEIDEAVITGRRKGLHGRFPKRQYWVFGLYSREQKYPYVFVVPNRRRGTLFPIIDHIVETNSTIFSDCFSVYQGLNQESRI